MKHATDDESKIRYTLEKGGIELRGFDGRSPRSLSTLFEEVRDSDVIVMIDEKTDRAATVRQSVEVSVSAEGYELMIIGKRYPGCDWTSYEGDGRRPRETRKRGETAIEAVQRCLREECGFEVPEPAIRLVHGSEDIQTEESSAYDGLLSIRCVQYAAVQLAKRPWEGERILPDTHGVELHTKWVSTRSLKEIALSLRESGCK